MKIGLRWRWILPLVMLIVFYPASAQDAVVQTPYTCPTETEFRSETPFTRVQVEDLLGFWHPLLQAVVDMKPIEASKIQYVFDFSCTSFVDQFYTSLFVPDIVTTVLAFTIIEAEVARGASYRLDTFYWMAFSMDLSQFGDRNFNGLPDWFIYGGDTGTQQISTGIRLLEWGLDGEIYEVELPSIGMNPRGFSDFNQDGIPEVFEYFGYFIPTRPFVGAARTGLTIWYGLEGDGYTMLAVQIPSFPESAWRGSTGDSGGSIRYFLNNFPLEHLCDNLKVGVGFMSDYTLNEQLYEILLYYHVWGQGEAGWTAIQPIWDQVATCPDSDSKRYFFDAIAKYSEDIAHRSFEVQ